MTPDQIAIIAAQVRDAGIPDICNRWLGMTPEAWAANEATRARINRGRIEVRRLPKTERRFAGSTRLPRSMDDTARALLKEQRKADEQKTKVRLARLRELREATRPRAVKTTPLATAPAQLAADAATQETDMPKAKGKTAKKAARAKSRTPVKAKETRGVRQGTKLETIVGLLKRPEGCTMADVTAAVGWKTMSFPQQAKAAGLTLTKEKKYGVTVYRAA